METGRDETAKMVRRARKGAPEAFDRLVAAQRPLLVHLATRLLADAHAAEDAAQEALVEAWVKLGQLKDDGKFAAWLNAILVNKCRQRSRKTLPIAMAVPEAAGEPGQEPGELELGAVLAEAAARLVTLPGRQGAVASAYYFHGQTCDQIAAQLGMTATAVSSALARARKRMRRDEAKIVRRGEAIMDNAQTDLPHVAATGDVEIRDLSLGEHRWGHNRLRAVVANRGTKWLHLGVGLRVCTLNAGNWQRQWYYEVAPGDLPLALDYQINRVFSPWYAVFRGPGVAWIRVTFARLAPEQFRQRLCFIDRPETVIFQRWFDAIVPAQSERTGALVGPVLPAAGDVTLGEVEPPPLTAGGHELHFTLHNHAASARRVGVHVETPGEGGPFDDRVIGPGPTQLTVPYVVSERAARAGRVGVALTVIQYPLNLDDLLGEFEYRDEEMFGFRARYCQEVPAATVAVVADVGTFRGLRRLR